MVFNLLHAPLDQATWFAPPGTDLLTAQAWLKGGPLGQFVVTAKDADSEKSFSVVVSTGSSATPVAVWVVLVSSTGTVVAQPSTAASSIDKGWALVGRLLNDAGSDSVQLVGSGSSEPFLCALLMLVLFGGCFLRRLICPPTMSVYQKAGSWSNHAHCRARSFTRTSTPRTAKRGRPPWPVRACQRARGNGSKMLGTSWSSQSPRKVAKSTRAA